jgi:hypothetical protein
MRKLPALLTGSALMALTSVWAGASSAAPIDLADTSTRAIDIYGNSNPCPNVPAGPAPPGCSTYADNAATLFSGSSFEGTLTNLSANDWSIDVAGPVWEAAVGSKIGFSDYDGVSGTTNGIVVGSVSALTVYFNDSTGQMAADPLYAGGSSWWTGQYFVNIFGGIVLPLNAADALDADDPFNGALFGNDLTVSCGSAGGPAPAPGDCPAVLTTQPGFVSAGPNGTTGTAFAQVSNLLGRPAWGPVDFAFCEAGTQCALNFVPEPGTLFLVSAGMLGLAAGGRRRRA